MLALMLVFALASGVSGGVAGNLTFHQPLFAAGMILQRGLGTRVWGSGAQPSATVTVRVLPAGARPVAPLTAISATATADAAGDWQVSLPVVDAQRSATLEATDGATTTSVSDVNFGEVILCGGYVVSLSLAPSPLAVAARSPGNPSRPAPRPPGPAGRQPKQHGVRHVRRDQQNSIAAGGPR